jgi:Mg/Co/Ni transporter MgtE
MSKHQRIEHKDLLSVLSDLDFSELIDLYIESKTSEYNVLDQLPMECSEKIEQLGNYLEDELNKIYSNHISFK